MEEQELARAPHKSARVWHTIIGKMDKWEKEDRSGNDEGDKRIRTVG